MKKVRNKSYWALMLPNGGYLFSDETAETEDSFIAEYSDFLEIQEEPIPKRAKASDKND